MPRVAAAVLVASLLAPSVGLAWRTKLPSGEQALALVADGGGAVYAAGATNGFGVSKLDASDGSFAWSGSLAAPGPSSRALAVAVTSSGDPVAAGTDSGDFVVARFDAATGLPLWERTIIDDGGTSQQAQARAVVMDAADDVFVAGVLRRSGLGLVLTAVKLDGATGAIDWQVEIAGDAASDTLHADIVVDAAGDAHVTGTVVNLASGQDAVLAKLDGATGGEIWRVEEDGVLLDQGRRIALTSTQDPVLHFLVDGMTTVLRYDGATGAESWRTLPSGGVVGLSVDAADDVIVAADNPMAAAKFDGAAGTELWANELEEGSGAGLDLVVDSAGHAYVGGRTGSTTSAIATVARFDGATGAVAWRRSAEVGQYSVVALDGAGDVIAADPQEEVVHIDAETGILGPVPGKKLLVREKLGDPASRKIVAVLEEVTLPAPGSANDPTIAGGTALLASPVTGESATFSLPPGAFWRGLGQPPGEKGYVYSDPRGTNGPCKKLKLIEGKIGKLTCVGKTGSIPFSLDEPSQGTLALSIQLGAAPFECGIFGGTVSKDIGFDAPSPIGIFKAKAAPMVGSCPAP